jgi:transposase
MMIQSVAAKIGFSGETRHNWVRHAERDREKRCGLTTDERARLKWLERANRELRQANDNLRKASAYLAAAELYRLSNMISFINDQRD